LDWSLTRIGDEIDAIASGVLETWAKVPVVNSLLVVVPVRLVDTMTQ
jgi:hypothetical protein